MDGMNNLRGMDGYLGERVMREMIKGGPAYYRLPHQSNDPLALFRAELREGQDKAAIKHRILSLKLPGLPLVCIRLPRWMPVGRLAA